MEEKYHPEDVSRRYFLNEELFLLWLFFFYHEEWSIIIF
jgi:hypothetical protein